MAGTPTLMGIAVENVGAIKAGRVLAYMAEWAIASEGGEKSLTVEEFAEKWLMSARQAYRQQTLFREAFPGESTPDRLVQAIGVHVRASAQRRSVRKVQATIANATMPAAA